MEIAVFLTYCFQKLFSKRKPAGPSQGLKIRGASSTGWDNVSPLVEIGLTMDNLHAGQLSRHFFFWQGTILRQTKITP